MPVFTFRLEEWIRDAEKKGFQPATIRSDVVSTRIRDCGRCILVNDEAKLDLIWDRIQPHLILLTEIYGTLPVGLNPNLNILRYHPGHYFKAHYDAHDRSVPGAIGILNYLNEDFQGGETVFLVEDGKKVSYTPKTGSVLIFDHNLFHKGAMVQQGMKYTLRTDLLFEIQYESGLV